MRSNFNNKKENNNSNKTAYKTLCDFFNVDYNDFANVYEFTSYLVNEYYEWLNHTSELNHMSIDEILDLIELDSTSQKYNIIY